MAGEKERLVVIRVYLVFTVVEGDRAQGQLLDVVCLLPSCTPKGNYYFLLL